MMKFVNESRACRIPAFAGMTFERGGLMPELPEVETVRRGVEPVWVGRRFCDVIVNRFDLRGWIPADFVVRVQGRSVERIVRRGKYMVVECDGGVAFVWHLGMSGSVRIYQGANVYEPLKHDHVVFETDNGVTVAFNDPRRFGMMYLVGTDWEAAEPFSRMGPEPLGNGFSAGVLYERLKAKRAPIKSALLDQRVVAGLGNIYVCEALYRAGVHPERLSRDVDEGEVAALVGHVRDVLNAAIESGGSSLRDHKMTDGSLAYFQHHFDVYDREGGVCGRCDEVCVERIVQSGRSSFFCSKTQK